MGAKEKLVRPKFSTGKYAAISFNTICNFPAFQKAVIFKYHGISLLSSLRKYENKMKMLDIDSNVSLSFNKNVIFRWYYISFHFPHYMLLFMRIVKFHWGWSILRFDKNYSKLHFRLIFFYEHLSLDFHVLRKCHIFLVY